MSRIYGLITAYVANGNGALALMIPKALVQKQGIRKGDQYQVGIGEHGEIIYVPNKESNRD